MTHYDPRIAALIAELERPNPEDEFPAATRGTLQYLRILQTSGPVEMLRAMEANILASLMALRVIAPTMDEAVRAYASLVLKNTSAASQGAATVRAEAASQGEAAMRSSMKGTVR